ncbi:MAG: LPS assembly protein LptD [Candidatus Acidiferrales bacterium]
MEVHKESTGWSASSGDEPPARAGEEQGEICVARCLPFGRRVRLWLLFPIMRNAIGTSIVRRFAHLGFVLFAVIIGAVCPAGAQEKPAAVQGGCQYGGSRQDTSIATIEAQAQHQVGPISYADGCVDILYQNMRLRADHVEYNDDTKEAIARGHVQLDHLSQHVEADEAHYNLQTGRGTFRHVRATLGMQRRPNPTLLISPNPLYFEAERAERIDEETYKVYKGWITVCRPDRPTWKFYAPEATVRLEKNVRLENADFRLLYIPIVYLPYATLPASRERESGFMIPDLGNSSVKGYFFGDAYYWAPTDWADTTIGATYLSKRGWSQNFALRMRPWENVKIDASYYGVIDRGLPQPTGPPLKEGGHEDHFGFDALLGDGWRAVADLNQLTSLTFRLAFAETFSQAVNSEVRNTAFVTNNFSGFSFDIAALSYKDFLSDSPESYVSLRTAPEARFSSVEQAPFKNLPVYLSFDAFTGAEHRSDTVTDFNTPNFVERSEFAPSVTMPLRWGPWLGVTPSFTLRTTRYGAQLSPTGTLLDQPFVRTTGELSIDIRPPALERIFQTANAKWKHTIEPDIVYRYVDGVNDFGRFVRFDEDETLTDTNEVEYGVRQRLFRRIDDDGDAQELVSWDIKEKYFFDPTFGGALEPGVRNVFQTLDAFTPFAFADQARHFSPIVSDIRVTPGGIYDAQFIVNYDPRRGQVTAIGTLLKLKPYRESFLTLAHFSTINLLPAEPAPGTTFHPRSDQIRTLIGYGDMNRRGWNTAVGFSYDLAQKAFQNQIAQVSYNGSCCGIGFEYRRLALGTVRSENQYRIVLLIANLGSAGNLRRQEKIF